MTDFRSCGDVGEGSPSRPKFFLGGNPPGVTPKILELFFRN